MDWVGGFIEGWTSNYTHQQHSCTDGRLVAELCNLPLIYITGEVKFLFLSMAKDWKTKPNYKNWEASI